MDLRYAKQKYDLGQLNSLEWLEGNGIGGYASSTILGCNTRKYHGLLVSRLRGFADKYLLLAQLDDLLISADKQYPLTVHRYAGDCLRGEAYDHFHEFNCDVHPQVIYRIAGDLYLSKEILMIYGEDTVLIKYKLVGSSSQQAKVMIKPLFAYRNFHTLTKENGAVRSALEIGQQNVSYTSYKVAPYAGLPECFITMTSNAEATPSFCWYRNLAYELEMHRGYDAIEDLFSPCVLELNFARDNEAIVACSVHECRRSLNEIWNDEIYRRKELARRLHHGSPLQIQLKRAAHTFLQKDFRESAAPVSESVPVSVPTPTPAPAAPVSESASAPVLPAPIEEHTIIAGYHWFLAWGRDAMTALPGLTLYSGMADECLMVLRTFAAHEKNGLIPNFIGSKAGEDAYNSVDASLWFAWAAQQYYIATKDAHSVAAHLWPTLKNIFVNYKTGTLHNIKMQDSGLLSAGNKDINLTWMDAMIGNRPVTPRSGMQIEVNALWFNLLCFMYEMAIVLGDQQIKQEITQLLPKIRLHFCQVFYADELGYLYDFVNDEEKNKCLRPNQIFAVSLPYSPLPKKIAEKVMDKVQEQLLTPYGLRTLAPQDPSYRGAYDGDQMARDYAYHNGTVWPWLLGHFGDALLKTFGKERALKAIQPCLAALKEHLSMYGVGTIAEVFSGDAPHRPGGCISQAWSVAEILRLTYLLNAKD
jgi:glycogen debranching enzyme